MYAVKKLPRTRTALLYQCTWLVDEDVEYDELTITETASIIAPEGKFVALSVDGMGRKLAPGHYVGRVRLSVSDGYLMQPHGLMKANQIARYFHTAVCVEDGRLAREKCIPELLHGGSVTDSGMSGVYIGSSEESFNGVVVTGDSEYVLDGVEMDLEGFADNDFLGVGAAVTAIDRAKVTINDSSFTMSGVTRCAIHAGGDSQVTLHNCDVENISPDSDRLGFFSWQVGFLGTNRLTQLTDNATVVYDHCRLKTNGWGVCSIDGSDDGVKMLLKDTTLKLSGPRAHGYGAFCIGENEVTFDHCEAEVNGYPMMLMGMQGLGRANIINGSVIRGRRFGAFVVGDDNSVFTIADSTFETGRACLCVKGSSTLIDVRNCVMKADDGVILQLMDTDEAGMNSVEFLVPVGETDTAIPGRDLSRVSEKEDVILRLSDMDVSGDFYNSTTNLRAYARGRHGSPGPFHDMLVGPVNFFDAPPEDMPAPPDHRGPKNLGLELKNARVTGKISSAGQAYRDGLTRITEENRLEMSNVRQWAQESVNNGVCVSLDKDSVWTVTGDCWITALELAPGARLEAPEGKTLKITVDGREAVNAPGRYAGAIRLEVR